MPLNKNTYSCVTLPNNLKVLCEEVQREIRETNENFKSQEYSGLHMTFIYLGERLSYQKTMEYVSMFDIVPPSEWLFTFDTYELFPPGKQNLVIAKFKPSPQIMKQRSDIVTHIGPSNLKDAEPYLWIPHITLGKLVGKQNKINLEFARLPDFSTSSVFVVHPY